MALNDAVGMWSGKRVLERCFRLWRRRTAQLTEGGPGRRVNRRMLGVDVGVDEVEDVDAASEDDRLYDHEF